MFRDLKSKEQMRIFNVRQVEMMVSEDEENVTNGAVLEGKQLRLKLTSLKMTCFFCVQTMWTKFGVLLTLPQIGTQNSIQNTTHGGNNVTTL